LIEALGTNDAIYKLTAFPATQPQGDFMTAIEQADALQQQAIALLLAERQQIDERLIQLGHGDKKSPVARQGRPPKQPETSFHSETTQPTLI
jgi:hypothetical protein